MCAKASCPGWEVLHWVLQLLLPLRLNPCPLRWVQPKLYLAGVKLLAQRTTAPFGQSLPVSIIDVLAQLQLGPISSVPLSQLIFTFFPTFSFHSATAPCFSTLGLSVSFFGTADVVALP